MKILFLSFLSISAFCIFLFLLAVLTEGQGVAIIGVLLMLVAVAWVRSKTVEKKDARQSNIFEAE